MEFILVLLALALPVAAIGGFVMAIGLRGRTEALERRLGALEAELAGLRGTPPADAAEASPAPTPATEAPPATQAPPSAPAWLPPVVEPPPFPEPPVAPAPAATPSAGIEESLGARWAVWVGGVALALGGVFLVRYSIEQGLLGPGARTAAGALFALALLFAGEVMRRREGAAGIAGIPGASVPAILTGAGVTSAFATAFAAHALYDLLGPATAFVTLGVIAVLAMLAAALHGPGLAALGLVGALACPLLVQSDAPRLWPLVVYLAFVGAAAYGVARLRLWAWLAGSAAAGGAAWGLALAFMGDAPPAMAHVLIQAALACLFLVAHPYRAASDAESRPDPLAAVALLAFAALGVVVALDAGTMRAAFAGALMALLIATAFRFPAGAPAAAWAALVAAGTLIGWPVAAEVAGAPVRVLPSLFVRDPLPEAVTAYLAFALASGLAVAAAGLGRIARGRDLPLPTAAWLSGAAVLGPLALLVVAWARVTALDASVPFALAAGLLGLAFTLAAAALRRFESGILDGPRLAVGALASAAVAALALGLTFALDRAALTAALALTALGTAWAAERSRVPALRWVVGALGALVAARIAWSLAAPGTALWNLVILERLAGAPLVIGRDYGTTPVLNWLLFDFGVPALAFLGASRVLGRGGRDGVARLMEGLALVFAALLVFLQIRHATTGGRMLAPAYGHLDIGLMAAASLAFAWLLVRVDALRPDPVSRAGGTVFAGVSLALSAVGLGLVGNPLLRLDPVQGGAVFNSLLAAYLLPAGLAGLLAVAARGVRPAGYVRAAGALSLVLLVAFALLAVRRAFQGPDLRLLNGAGQGEMWAYSVALLAVGAALLAFGLWRGLREARLASGVVIAAAVLKVFLIDLGHLEGALRAFSFIGLGLALVAIGLAYQRLLGRPAVGGAPH